MSILKMGTATLATENAGSIDINSGVNINRGALPAGMPIQIVTNHIITLHTYTNIQDVGSYPNNPENWTETAVTGSITPHFSNSRILIEMFSAWGCPSDANHISQGIKRQVSGSSAIGLEQTTGTSVAGSTGMMGSQLVSAHMNNHGQYQLWPSMVVVEDTPNSNGLSVTYTLTIGAYSGTEDMFLNRTQAHRNTTDGYDPVATSTVKLTEISV